MDQSTMLNLNVGVMSDTNIIISCVEYNHDILLISDFQEQVIEQLVTYYHHTLIQNKAVLNRLSQMGFKLSDVKALNLGLCDRTLNQVVASNRHASGANVRGVLELHGLLRNTGHEVFRGCAIMPLYDENGCISGIFGRRLAQYIRGNGRRHILWLATQDAINKLVFPPQLEELRYVK